MNSDLMRAASLILMKFGEDYSEYLELRDQLELNVDNEDIGEYTRKVVQRRIASYDLLVADIRKAAMKRSQEIMDFDEVMNQTDEELMA